MSVRTKQGRYSRRIIIWALAVLSLAAIGVGGYLYFSRDNNPIPPALRSQLTFSPFALPKDTKNYTSSDYKFSPAEGNEQILSYVIHTQSGNITASEYTQPSQFTEIPGYKDSFLSNVIQQYATVQTSNGTIYLGRLPRQNNKQLAIMIERGLLLLMSPDKELDSSQWRNLGDQLEIQKIVN